jgi:transcription initiation factor TFIIB
MEHVIQVRVRRRRTAVPLPTPDVEPDPVPDPVPVTLDNTAVPVKTWKKTYESTCLSSNGRATEDHPPRKMTKKNKRVMSLAEKQRLWDIFNTDTSGDVLSSPLEESGSPQLLRCADVPSSPTSAPSAPPALHVCEQCQSVLVIMDDGFPTCPSPHCGIMYKNVLDHSPEWRFFAGGDKHAIDPTRCGGPINPLLVESSFGCKILCDSRSSYEMKKLKKWTEWQSCPHREKSLYEEFQFITTMAQNAGIPRIFIDSAMTIHKDISEQKMFRGMNRDGIKAASIYLSCRLNGCPRTAHEIAAIFHLDRQSATYGCSTAVKLLNNIERNMDPENKMALTMTRPSAFIERFCSHLHVSSELAMLAKFIANKLEQNVMVCDDNTPQSSAAGIIYFVSHTFGLGITKMRIKDVCGVSEVTINKCYRKLSAMKADLIPKCLVEKYRLSAF